jgi:YHS domain-containing protein
MAKQKDPVCGMEVEERSALWKSSKKGQTHIFCSKECQEQFDQHPEKYSVEQQQPS